MPSGTKPLKVILAAEVGAACLFLVALLGWQLWPKGATLRLEKTPAAAALPETPVIASPTPFLPASGPLLVWGPGQNPPAIETARALPTFSVEETLPLPPTPVPGIIPTPVDPMTLKGLNYLQQLQLYSVSLRYVAPTPREALHLARDLNFIGRDSHPSNMCGPLSIAILREAGLVSPETKLEPFWLLNPRQRAARTLLAQTFPAERFDHLVAKTALNQMDWKTSPLLPGDFVYLYAGLGGNFEHMLVVNRVDSFLRAFAVTNYATEEGFVIQEMLLYDPNDKSVGLFATWTERPDAILGSTGFGGFEVWRLRQP